MSYVNTYFSVSITSGVTLSSMVDLGQAFKNVYLQVPTMASGDLYIKASPSSDGTFSRVCEVKYNTSTVHQDFKIGSATSLRIVPIPTGGCRFVKVESSSGCTDVTTTFNFICGD